MNVAFIGTGRMGAAMVRNLVAAGHKVTAYNRTRERSEGLGAAVANTPAEACRGAEAVMSMLSDDRAIEEVVFGKDPIGGLPHISCSTISTAMARRLAAHAPDTYISAPVFGRPEAAEMRKLSSSLQDRQTGSPVSSRCSTPSAGRRLSRVRSPGRPMPSSCAAIS